MTTVTDIYNRALQQIGQRTTLTDAEIANETSNEAIQLNLVYENVRDDLSRMAPWNCCFNYANLIYITSAPGTPENSSPATTTWQKGQPAPPWLYEYQYPVDCLRACFIVPVVQSNNFGSVPIYPTTVGFTAQYLQGPAVRFRVGVDQFYPVTAAAVAAAGSGYAVGDLITLASGATGSAPIGAPAVLQVATLSGSGVATVTVVDQVADSATRTGGSYFARQTNPVAQGSTTGSGSGATFNLTFGAVGDQRVILTDRQNPTLAYCKKITDPNVFDTLFQSALIQALAATVCQALTGDAALVKTMVALVNQDIAEARKGDGNEGLTINDATPDWLRIRGVSLGGVAPVGQGFDWGPLWQGV